MWRAQACKSQTKIINWGCGIGSREIKAKIGAFKLVGEQVKAKSAVKNNINLKTRTRNKAIKNIMRG